MAEETTMPAQRITYAQFEGVHGEHVTVQLSAAPGDPKVWLVADRGGDNNGALHLTAEQAKTVRDALDVFLADAKRLTIEAKQEQTWQVGDPEPVGMHVRDRAGVYWYPFMGGWRNGSMDAYAAITWAQLLQRGPLRWAADR